MSFRRKDASLPLSLSVCLRPVLSSKKLQERLCTYRNVILCLRPCSTAECFYLGAMDCFLALWHEGGRPRQLRPLQDVLHRAGQRAKSNVWPMIQRALALEEESGCPA